jgi:hypothetical protein
LVQNREYGFRTQQLPGREKIGSAIANPGRQFFNFLHWAIRPASAFIFWQERMSVEGMAIFHLRPI